MNRDRIRGLLLLATLVLVVLKLSGEIAWSWVIVFAPLWVPAALDLGIRVAVVAVGGALVYLLILGGDLTQLPEVMRQIPLIGELPWGLME